MHAHCTAHTVRERERERERERSILNLFYMYIKREQIDDEIM